MDGDEGVKTGRNPYHFGKKWPPEFFVCFFTILIIQIILLRSENIKGELKVSKLELLSSALFWFSLGHPQFVLIFK